MLLAVIFWQDCVISFRFITLMAMFFLNRAKVYRFIAWLETRLWLESSRHDANMVDFSLGTSSQASVRQSGVLGSPGRKSCRCDSEGLWVKALTSLSTSSAPCPLLSGSELRMIDETGRVCSSLSCVRDSFSAPNRDEMTVVLSRFQSSASLCEQAVTAA